VQINETATEVEPSTTPARLSSRHCKSILHSNNNIDPPSNENNKVKTSSAAQTKEIYNHSQKLFCVFSVDGMEETSYHVIDFAGLYPVWPIVKFSMSPTGNTKDKRMSLFTKCVTALLGEMLYFDNKAMIAPIAITDNDCVSYISNKADLPTNFTKLGKHIMISGGSWVFNKKERGNNNVYACFRLKSQIPTKEIINRVSFKFSCLGSKNLYLKQHQAMETKTPVMLLFVCNGNETESIISDTRQMLDSAYEAVDKNKMMPEEFKNKDIPHLTLRVNVPRLPAETKSNSNKGYDHYKEHGKKAFHY
jgi:hypothetical protein